MVYGVKADPKGNQLIGAVVWILNGTENAALYLPPQAAQSSRSPMSLCHAPAGALDALTTRGEARSAAMSPRLTEEDW